MKPGDILAVRGSAWLSKRILAATGNTVSHVGMIISTDPEPTVIEALKRVTTRPLTQSIAAAEKAYILSNKNLGAADRLALVNSAMKFSADGYNWGDIALQFVNHLTGSTWATDHLSIGWGRILICSYLDADAYNDIGIVLADPPKLIKSITPADIYANALKHPDVWDITEIK